MYYEPPDAESPILTKKANTRKQKPEKKHGEKKKPWGSSAMPLKASKGHLKAGQYPFACAFGPTPQEIQSPEQRRPSMRRVFVCLRLNHLGLMWRSQACELLPASSTCARKLWRRCSSTRIWVPPLTFSRRGGRATSSKRRKPT